MGPLSGSVLFARHMIIYPEHKIITQAFINLEKKWLYSICTEGPQLTLLHLIHMSPFKYSVNIKYFSDMMKYLLGMIPQ